jgi:RimJ/RimL family protein N-acetyltransferase
MRKVCSMTILSNADIESSRPGKSAASFVRVLETERLALRWVQKSDAAFILRLVNEPSWIEQIGDEGVRSLRKAERYIQSGVMEQYRRHGFGLYLVETKQDTQPIGICGITKHELLEDADLGFAFLPKFWGKGYAFESAAAVMSFAKARFGLSRIVAMTSGANPTSVNVLVKLGFSLERLTQTAIIGEELEFYGTAL